jgi:nucleoside-diphosphate-sugar epimerase
MVYSERKNTWVGKQVMVTGSSGFIGKHLVAKLEEAGASILQVCRGEKRDVTEPRTLGELPDVELIYHLAAVTHVPFSFQNPLETYCVNLTGTLNVLEFARQRHIRRLVFVSSYVYGKPRYLPIDERHPLQPTNPYARSKVLGEELCRAYHDDYGLAVSIVRPFNVYGPGQAKKFLIPTILHQMLHSEKVILKDPHPKRDFIHVQDIVTALLRVVDANLPSYLVLNLGSGHSYSAKEIAGKILSNCGKKVNLYFTGEQRGNEIMDCVADISVGRHLLGWDPRIDLDEGLADLVEDALSGQFQ